MPYIAIKAYPRDMETKKALARKVNEAVLEVLGCKPEAVTISFEDIPKEEWQEKVAKPEIEPKMDKMMIVSDKEMQ